MEESMSSSKAGPYFVDSAAKAKVRLVGPSEWEIVLTATELPPHTPIEILQHMTAVGEQTTVRPRHFYSHELWRWPAGVDEHADEQGVLLPKCDPLRPERYPDRAQLWARCLLVDEQYVAIGDEDSGATPRYSEALYTLRGLCDASLVWRYVAKFRLFCSARSTDPQALHLLRDLVGQTVPLPLTVVPGDLLASDGLGVQQQSFEVARSALAQLTFEFAAVLSDSGPVEGDIYELAHAAAAVGAHAR
jgi:hypothetical protein